MQVNSQIRIETTLWTIKDEEQYEHDIDIGFVELELYSCYEDTDNSIHQNIIKIGPVNE